ncbi:MAG: L,D-transpeptidase [Gammaproteobacteria bacterium]|nr:L,D-transpeptidase [Gammaproteobacteria bacterium]
MKKYYHIEININEQKLRLCNGKKIEKEYPVSTAKNGAGELIDSECTPRGEHIIAEKIGADCLPNTVFVERLPTGEIYSPELRKHFPDRDWILTRILWLKGEEPGCNQGGDVDSHERFIYIHGSPDDVQMGKPGSRGCIRMCNRDVIELFDKVIAGTRVVVFEK